MKKKTKTSIFTATAAAVCFILLGFQAKRYAAQTVDLRTAIAQKLVSVDFRSNGNYSGRSLVCRLRNISGKSLNVRIPAGTYLKAPQDDEQNLIIPQEKVIAMTPGSNIEQVLDGFCTEAHDRAPAQGGVFALAEHKIPKMNELLVLLNNKPFESSVIQGAVWAVTNGESLAGINAEGDAAVKDFRTQLSKLTGQPDPWYNAPQNRTVTEDRRIRNETVAISGDLVFNSKKGKKISQELVNAAGTVLWTMKETTILYDGEVKYKFSIKVQGWEKGKYTVQVKEGATLVKSFDFEV